MQKERSQKLKKTSTWRGVCLSEHGIKYVGSVLKLPLRKRLTSLADDIYLLAGMLETELECATTATLSGLTENLLSSLIGLEMRSDALLSTALKRNRKKSIKKQISKTRKKSRKSSTS